MSTPDLGGVYSREFAGQSRTGSGYVAFGNAADPRETPERPAVAPNLLSDSRVEGWLCLLGGAALGVYGANRQTKAGAIAAFLGSGLALYGSQVVFGSTETFDIADTVLSRDVEVRRARRAGRDAMAGNVDPDAGTQVRGLQVSIPAHVSIFEAPQPITTVTPHLLMNALELALDDAFPGEAFLTEELEGIVQGFRYCFRWMALRSAKEAARMSAEEPTSGTRAATPVVSLETTNLFASPWMDRTEIVGRIQACSGINYEAADKALRCFEDTVVEGLRQSTEIEVERIGRIRRSGDGFVIDLVDELQTRRRVPVLI